MHRDDSTEVVVVAGRPVLVVVCAPDGTCDPKPLSASLAARPDVESVWLSVDGTAPDEAVVSATAPNAAAVTASPMVDAVKQVDAADLVTRTVDRSTLRLARPPALIPRRLASEAVEQTPCRPLDGLPGVGEVVELG